MSFELFIFIHIYTYIYMSGRSVTFLTDWSRRMLHSQLIGCGCLHYQAVSMCSRCRCHHLSVKGASRGVPSGFPCRSPQTHINSAAVCRLWCCLMFIFMLWFRASLSDTIKNIQCHWCARYAPQIYTGRIMKAQCKRNVFVVYPARHRFPLGLFSEV